MDEITVLFEHDEEWDNFSKLRIDNHEYVGDDSDQDAADEEIPDAEVAFGADELDERILYETSIPTGSMQPLYDAPHLNIMNIIDVLNSKMPIDFLVDTERECLSGMLSQYQASRFHDRNNIFINLHGLDRWSDANPPILVEKTVSFKSAEIFLEHVQNIGSSGSAASSHNLSDIAESDPSNEMTSKVHGYTSSAYNEISITNGIQIEPVQYQVSEESDGSFDDLEPISDLAAMSTLPKQITIKLAPRILELLMGHPAFASIMKLKRVQYAFDYSQPNVLVLTGRCKNLKNVIMEFHQIVHQIKNMIDEEFSNAFQNLGNAEDFVEHLKNSLPSQRNSIRPFISKKDIKNYVIRSSDSSKLLNVIVVTNLPPNTRVKEFNNHCLSIFGDVLFCDIIQKSRRALVLYAEKDDALKARTRLHNSTWKGYTMTVEYARANNLKAIK